MNIKFIKEVGVFNWIFRNIQRQLYKRVLKRNHSMLLPTGQRFILPTNSKFASEAFITNANVDWGSEALLFKLLNKRGAFLDVGANIGYYSLYMLPRVKSVYSFEPDPRTLKLLRQNTKTIPDIHIIPNAVGRSDGEISFTLENDGEVSHLSMSEDIGKNMIKIKITTIDSFVQDNNLEVEAIKIDIEGFDIDAIAGAVDTLMSQRSIILTEAIPTPELFEIMIKVGYKVYAFVRNIESREKHFDEIKTTVSPGFITKMLFLIPEESDKIMLEML